MYIFGDLPTYFPISFSNNSSYSPLIERIFPKKLETSGLTESQTKDED